MKRNVLTDGLSNSIGEYLLWVIAVQVAGGSDSCLQLKVYILCRIPVLARANPLFSALSLRNQYQVWSSRDIISGLDGIR